MGAATAQEGVRLIEARERGREGFSGIIAEQLARFTAETYEGSWLNPDILHAEINAFLQTLEGRQLTQVWNLIHEAKSGKQELILTKLDPKQNIGLPMNEFFALFYVYCDKQVKQLTSETELNEQNQTRLQVLQVLKNVHVYRLYNRSTEAQHTRLSILYNHVLRIARIDLPQSKRTGFKQEVEDSIKSLGEEINLLKTMLPSEAQ